MKKKVMLASLLAIGLAAGVGTQIHAQDTAYLCGGYHSHMHSAADGCLRTLKEQQAARDAAAKRQAEAAQRQAQATLHPTLAHITKIATEFISIVKTVMELTS